MFTYIQETFYYAVKIVPLFPETGRNKQTKKDSSGEDK